MAGSIETSEDIASQTSSRDVWENMLSGQPVRQIIEADDPNLFVDIIPLRSTKFQTALERLRDFGRKGDATPSSPAIGTSQSIPQR